MSTNYNDTSGFCDYYLSPLSNRIYTICSDGSIVYTIMSEIDVENDEWKEINNVFDSIIKEL
jgi:hypothetical protein